nr:replication initiation protein [Microvirus sp.]
MCLAPRRAWIATNNYCTEYRETVTPFGSWVDEYGGEYKRKLWFKEPIKLEDRKEIQIPCRHCFECVQSYSTNWALRCCLEAKLHSKNCFLTLTYDNEHLEDISVKTLQKFFKRLRKHFGARSLRYFACGEYGERTARPHYHVILFGVDFSEDRQFLRTDKRKNVLYYSGTLAKLWKFGFHSIGDLSFESAKYCAKYMQKFNFENGKKAFTLQSRKPAIGYVYAMEHVASICETGKVYINGREFNAPWQFKKWYQKRAILARFATKLDTIKKTVARSFDFVYELARERRRETVRKFGFWDIKTKILKEQKNNVEKTFAVARLSDSVAPLRI